MENMKADQDNFVHFCLKTSNNECQPGVELRTVDLSDPAFSGGNQPTSSDYWRDQETVEEQTGTVGNIIVIFRFITVHS